MAMGMSLKTKYAVGTVIVAEDGSGDFIDIESAIDSLPNTGGVVYIKEGTYSISSGITITKSNVSILGAGSSTIINIANGETAFTLSADGFTIEDLYFVSTTAQGAEGIDISTYKHVKINRCSFIDFTDSIYAASGSTDVVISNNYFEDPAGNAAIRTYGMCKITNNDIYHTLASETLQVGIEVNGTHSSVIGNRVRITTAVDVNCIATSSSSSYNSFVSNILETTEVPEVSGISLAGGSSYNSVIGNIIIGYTTAVYNGGTGNAVNHNVDV